MSKKKKRKEERAAGGKTPEGDVSGTSALVENDPLSLTGKKTIAAGVVLAAVGFLVLTRADSMGRNWAGSLSPFLILGGYAVMGWGIFRDDPQPPAAVVSAAAPQPSSSEAEKTS